MSELKQQLLEAIEAYAAARATNNPLVVRTMGEMLMRLVESVEVVSAESVTQSADQIVTDSNS